MSEKHTVEGDTYEMLWDCKFCRTPKLLGLTHRHCPVCGAPQNAEQRYFPADDEKVAVANHRYVGRDRVCAHCNTFNSRSGQHCRDCGAPLDGSKEAPVHDPSENRDLLGNTAAAAAHRVRAAPARRSRAAQIVALTIGVLLLCLGVFLFWKRDQTFEVVGHTWERTIDVERFGPVRESAWCDQLPSSAREIKRYREVRSHEQVRDGETCTMRRVDQGDGTFREVRHCEPRYTSRAIYDYQCDYEVNKWAKVRTSELKGQSLTSAPQWPLLNLAVACRGLGCEREGRRHEEYSVILEGPDGNTKVCSLNQDRWQNASLGQHYIASVRVVGGGINCDSLSLR